MIIDCDRCAVRGRACGDCVVGLLMGTPDGTGLDTELEPEIRRAVNLFAEAGMLAAPDQPTATGRGVGTDRGAPPRPSVVPAARHGRRGRRPARVRRSA